MSRKNGLQLDADEAGLLAEFERGEFESIRRFRDEKRRVEEAAASTLRKNKRINIRISERDLEALQKIALREGIPYQTLISSTLHKFVSGRMKEAD